MDSCPSSHRATPVQRDHSQERGDVAIRPQDHGYSTYTDPFIVHWPKGIQEKGGIRRQYHHAIDVVPTILEAIGIDMPDSHHGVAQKPIEGVSMQYFFDGADEPDRKETQYYEILGTRALCTRAEGGHGTRDGDRRSFR